jgi:hypothetical protein
MENVYTNMYIVAVRSVFQSFGIGILWPFGVFLSHLVCPILRPFGNFGTSYEEKSGNPGPILLKSCL